MKKAPWFWIIGGPGGEGEINLMDQMRTVGAKKSKKLPWAHEIAKIGREAIRKAVQSHYNAGRPITVMIDGRVVKLSPRHTDILH